MATGTHVHGHFGADRGNRSHEGCDFSSPVGTPLINKTPMTVVSVLDTPTKTGGNGLILRDQYGTEYYYAHLDTAPNHLQPGMRLEPGTYLGSTGNSGVDGAGKPYAPHLHHEVWPGGKKPGGKPANPESIDPNTGKPYYDATTYNVDSNGNPINNLRTGSADPSKFKPGKPAPAPGKNQTSDLNSDKKKRNEGLFNKPTTPKQTPKQPNDNLGNFIKQRGLIQTNDVHKMHDGG